MRSFRWLAALPGRVDHGVSREPLLALFCFAEILSYTGPSQVLSVPIGIVRSCRASRAALKVRPAHQHGWREKDQGRQRDRDFPKSGSARMNNQEAKFIRRVPIDPTVVDAGESMFTEALRTRLGRDPGAACLVGAAGRFCDASISGESCGRSLRRRHCGKRFSPGVRASQPRRRWWANCDPGWRAAGGGCRYYCDGDDPDHPDPA